MRDISPDEMSGTMAKKRSLLEELATLEKPDDFDIEDVDRHDQAERGSDLELDEETVANDHYVKVGKLKLRQPVAPLGGKYTGAKLSRRDLQDEFSAGSSDEESPLENEESPLENEESPDDESMDDDAAGSDSGASLRANSDDDELESDSDAASDGEPEDLEYKRQQLAALMAQERTHLVNKLLETATADALKGFAVQQQHQFFDRVLDARLKLQKAVTTANQLPYDQAAAELVTTKKTPKHLDQAREQCYDLLDAVFALRSQLLGGSDEVSLPKKRLFAEYNATTALYDAQLEHQRHEVLTKWSAKVQNSQGLLAINQAKFKTINQLYDQQVSNNLGDMARLVKRTKLNRRMVKPLGEARVEQEDEDEEEDENPDIPKEQRVQLGELEGIFDDDDFYRMLLNDLVDKKIQDQNPTQGLTVMRTAQKAQKLNKNVDTKALKGRKLRYHVQEPIANFDAPRSGWAWDDQQIDDFFAGLLGQKVNMDEVEEVADDEVKVTDDSIRLFG